MLSSVFWTQNHMLGKLTCRDILGGGLKISFPLFSQKLAFPSTAGNIVDIIILRLVTLVLLRWKQADPRGPYSVTSTADSCLNAFHRSTLQFGMPYHETLLEQLSLSFSAVTRFFKMKATYQSAMYQCNSLRSVNGGNRYHGRGDQKKKPKHSQM